MILVAKHSHEHLKANLPELLLSPAPLMCPKTERIELQIKMFLSEIGSVSIARTRRTAQIGVKRAYTLL